MIVEIQGMLVKALEKRNGVSKSGNPWASQTFVVNENDKTIVFDVFGEDNINSIAKQMNSPIKVKCVINCREWNGKYFTSLQYYAPREEYTSATQPQQSSVTQQTQATTSSNSDSDFPF